MTQLLEKRAAERDDGGAVPSHPHYTLGTLIALGIVGTLVAIGIGVAALMITASRNSVDDALVAEKAKANTAGLKKAYSAATNGTQSFDQLIEDETSGYSNWELRELVKAGGKLSDEEELFFATAGAGTDEDKIKEVLKGKTPAEIDRIRWEMRDPAA